jgi:hypothetical protein
MLLKCRGGDGGGVGGLRHACFDLKTRSGRWLVSGLVSVSARVPGAVSASVAGSVAGSVSVSVSVSGSDAGAGPGAVSGSTASVSTQNGTPSLPFRCRAT